MAIAFVQDDASNAIADGGTLAYTNNVGNNTCLVVKVGFADLTSTVVGITDTRGNTYTLRKRQTYDGGGGATTAVETWAAHCPTGGANTITCDWSAAVNGAVIIEEYSGFTNGVSLDQSNGNGATGSSFNHGSVTTTQATAVSTTAARGTTAFSVSAVGDSFNAGTYGARLQAHYKTLSGTETHDCDLTYAASEIVAGAIVTLYETAAAGLKYPQLERMTRGLERGLNQGIH